MEFLKRWSRLFESVLIVPRIGTSNVRILYLHFMFQKSKTVIRIYTLGRVLLFCLSCAIVLAIASRITQGVSKPFSEYLSLVIAGIITFGLTLLFVRWEGLRLRDVGLVPGQRSI